MAGIVVSGGAKGWRGLAASARRVAAYVWLGSAAGRLGSTGVLRVADGVRQAADGAIGAAVGVLRAALGVLGAAARVWQAVAGVGLAATLATTCTAGVYLTADQAARLAFPGADVQRQAIYLTAAEVSRIEALAGTKPESAIVTRFTARRDGQHAGAAYTDTHRVRTLLQTLLVVLDPEGEIRRVETLSFFEPEEYLPRPIWFAQFEGRGLDDGLSLKSKIRPVAGATLTARAVTDAARRVLALDRVLADRTKP